jgi:hypothetical protein
MADAGTVKQGIRSAFSELPVPVSIIDVEVGDKETRQALRAALQGKRWSEISNEVLRFHHDALGFLSPVGVRYLLPAFMVAALDSPSSPIVDVLVGVLTRPQEAQDEQRFLDIMSPLTDPQRAAVRSFLEYLRDEAPEDWPDDEPGKALREYWTLERTS